MTKFVLTEHAKQRIDDRFGTKPKKWLSLTKKVWEKGHLLPDWWIKHQKSKGYFLQYRLFQGFVFVFDVETNKDTIIFLVTIQKYKPGKIEVHYNK